MAKLKEIYGRVEEIRAIKGKDSLWPNQPFKHVFGRGVKLYGVSKLGKYILKNGDLVVRSKNGKRLWKNFEYVDRKGEDVRSERFLTNPPSLVVVGVNPPRKLRRRAGARKRRFRIGRAGSKHRPVVYTEGKRWRVSPKAHVAKRGAFVNPLGESPMSVGGNPMARYYHYYRRKSNPNGVKLGVRGLTEVQRWVPLALAGALSATATGTVPAMFGLTGPWMKVGGQLATAFLGGMLVRQVWSKEAGNIWAVVGASLVMYDMLKTWVFSRFFPGLPLGMAYHGYDEAMRADSQSVGQYPDEISAYPEEVAAYPEEVSAYPYDGDYPY